MSKLFQRLTKLHEPIEQVQFVVFEKIYRLIYSKLYEQDHVITYL